MDSRKSDQPRRSKPPDSFASTHWSLVLCAAKRDSSAAQAALENLCRTYWYPVYAYVRRRTKSAEDAQDLTQEFFARLCERNSLQTADPERGRFRAFLLTMLKNFLVNEWEKNRTQKRGGGQPMLPLDFVDAEYRFAAEPAETASPDKTFEREWALALLQRVLERLQQEFVDSHKSEQFELFRPFLTGQNEPAAHAKIGRKLQMSETAVRAAVYRLRKRYRELLHEEVSQTISSPDQAQDELRDLFDALAR